MKVLLSARWACTLLMSALICAACTSIQNNQDTPEDTKDATATTAKQSAQSTDDDSAVHRSISPSTLPGYATKVRARILPNLVFPSNLRNIQGNPDVTVEVRTASDGTITNRHILKSSGVPSWDSAVLRAIDKTQTLPRDVDGRVPSPILIDFMPY